MVYPRAWTTPKEAVALFVTSKGRSCSLMPQPTYRTAGPNLGHSFDDPQLSTGTGHMDVFHVHLGKIFADFQRTEDIKWNTEPPTKPSFYWFQREPTSRALMVGIRATDGQLTVWCAEVVSQSRHAQSGECRGFPFLRGFPIEKAPPHPVRLRLVESVVAAKRLHGRTARGLHLTGCPAEQGRGVVRLGNEEENVFRPLSSNCQVTALSSWFLLCRAVS